MRHLALILCGLSFGTMVFAQENERPVSRAEAKHCFMVTGSFSAVPPELCDSPYNLCTLGALSGNFPGTYAFGVDLMAPSDDPSIPSKIVYSGHSVISRRNRNEDRDEKLFGHDRGYMVIKDGFMADFVTTVRLFGGTRGYEDASGTLVAAGVLNLVTGTTEGSYTGTICKKRRNDEDDRR